MSATIHHIDYPRCKAKNWWCSIHACFQIGAVTVSVFRMPIMAGNSLVVHNSDQITSKLPYQMKNHGHSIDARLSVLFIQHLLLLIMVFTMNWCNWLTFSPIETQPFCQARPSNLLALVNHILLKLIYLVKWFILPAILLFINQYLHGIAHNSPIICP